MQNTGIPITADKVLSFRPMALEDHETLSNVIIKVRVPTPFERDAYVSNLLMAGVVQHTKEQFNNITKAGIVALYKGDEKDHYLSLLELAIEFEKAKEDCLILRSNKYQEMTDLPDGADLPSVEEIEAELEKIQPEDVISESDRDEILAVQAHLQKSYQPLVKAISDFNNRDSKTVKFNVQHYVSDWEGLEFNPAQPCDIDNPLKEHEVIYLRTQIGKLAFEQIGGFILAMQSIDQDEEKNLSLLLESMSAQIGSKSITEKSQESSTGTLNTDQEEESSLSATETTQGKKSKKKTAK